MEATRLIIPSFLDGCARSIGEKNLALSRRTRGRMYTEDGFEEANRRRGDLGKQFVLSRESTFDPWERVVHRGQPFLVPVAGLFEKTGTLLEKVNGRGG